ncbi:MAG: histidinol-phosphatase HisJ family protein [Erysipelotrichia bacterium]|nr:histidinol-phosphatase HisJ family protein [Erysipelotrichia bacterium]
MLADYHVHTYYSDDSEYMMEEVVKDAIKLGIDEICFTDHVDYGVKRDWDDVRGFLTRDDGTLLTNVHYPRYFAEIAKYKEKYQDQISIKKGLEFGIQTHTIKDFQKLFAAYPLDFVIMSVHQVNDMEVWPQWFQQGKNQKEYNRLYYQEILNVIKEYKDYCVLGHLDSIVRYDLQGRCPFEYIEDLVVEILRQAIKDNKGIEVNTSCYRYGLSDLTPARNIIELYRDLGGKIITLGSDSHKKEHLGYRLKETKAELLSMGFEYFCTFDNMVPQFHEL